MSAFSNITLNLTQVFVNFAMALYGNETIETGAVFALTPTAVFINLLSTIRAVFPRTGNLIIAVAPFIVTFLAWLKFFGFLTVILYFHMSKKWMAGQGMRSNARNLTLKPRDGPGQEKDDEYDEEEEEEEERNGKPDLLECQPSEGTYWFQFKGRWFRFSVYNKVTRQFLSTGQAVQVPADSPQVSISCFSIWAGVAPVQVLLEHMKSLHAASQQSRTTIWRATTEDGKPTFNGTTRAARTLSCVALADEKKTPLVKKIGTYLSKETELFYASRGIPLRRGYLLYGPPGTGKTSFATAIAGHFELEVFVINLATPGLDDRALETLFDFVSGRCIVLLEDIDSAGIQRERMRENSARRAKDAAPKTTLSALLNVLDGPCSQEGRLLFMTSNSPDSLDPALVRPGRIDSKVFLVFATTEVLKTMFKHIFTKTSKDSGEENEMDHIDGLATEFSSAVPSKMLTPAEVQNFLVQRRESPEIAALEAKQWAADLIALKERGFNVAEGAGDIGADGEKAGFKQAEHASKGAEDFSQNGECASKDGSNDESEYSDFDWEDETEGDSKLDSKDEPKDEPRDEPKGNTDASQQLEPTEIEPEALLQAMYSVC